MSLISVKRYSTHGRTFLHHEEFKTEDFEVARHQLFQRLSEEEMELGTVEFEDPANLLLIFSPVSVSLEIRASDESIGTVTVGPNQTLVLDASDGVRKYTGVTIIDPKPDVGGVAVEVTAINKPGRISWRD